MRRRLCISAAEARRFALAAQGLHKARPTTTPDRRHFATAIENTGLLQLDFVNVLVPAHYLVAWSRLGHYNRDRLDDYLYRSGRYIEHWAHEASTVPVRLWPLLAYRREQWRPWKNNPIERLADPKRYLAEALEIVRREGAVTANDLPQRPGPKRRGGDWHRSVARWALEYHFGSGRLAVAERKANFQRIYDLPERIIPAQHLSITPTEPQAHRELLLIAASRLGIATSGDLADYFRMRGGDVLPRLQELLEMNQLQQVEVEGWSEPAWLAVGARLPRKIDGACLLSPFDPLIWCRPRLERLFDFHYRLEIYVPESRRRWGYYVLPFRMGDEIVARVDLKADRSASTLRVQSAHLEESARAGPVAEALARELRMLATWLQLDRVQIRRRGDFDRALRRCLQT